VKITLRGIRPPIWRRVQVPGSLPLAALHDVIQTVFGWTDTHLHQFVIAGETYGRPDDFDEALVDETAVTLGQAAGTRTKRFAYVYDFGDNWEHEVVVEKIVAGNSGSERPLCLGGRRHRPPEDCGGPPGYQNFLEAIRDPGHEEHEAMLEWVGGSFDAEAFDLAMVNRALAAVPRAGWSVQ
jgi:Plasmid pRiA4b ORF-3-like protein